MKLKYIFLKYLLPSIYKLELASATILIFGKDFRFLCQRTSFQDIFWKLFDQRPYSCSLGNVQDNFALLEIYNPYWKLFLSIYTRGEGLPNVRHALEKCQKYHIFMDIDTSNAFHQI
jgi:hypothetical protein